MRRSPIVRTSVCPVDEKSLIAPRACACFSHHSIRLRPTWQVKSLTERSIINQGKRIKGYEREWLVPVPPLSGDQVREYITKLYSDDDVKDCALIFAAGLPRNPRKVKRILQNFLFLRDLAVNSKQAEDIQLSLLAKLVVIQNQFRDVYREIVCYPILLEELEKYYQKK